MNDVADKAGRLEAIPFGEDFPQEHGLAFSGRGALTGPFDGPLGGSVKRATDILVASIALVVLSPFMVVAMLAVKLTDRGPALFRQERVGYDGRRFRCLKFRSMVMDADVALQKLLAVDEGAAREWQETQKLRRDPRITPIGRFLRATSIDELPQLFNVLAGDMSMVGPRPIVPQEVPRYGAQIAFYHATKPGLTGLWQVSGRSECSYPERVALDVDYVRSWSFVRDLGIMARTVLVVVSRKGSW